MLAQKNAELLKATKRILAAMNSLDAKAAWAPKPWPLEHVVQRSTEEVRELIRLELGKYLKP